MAYVIYYVESTRIFKTRDTERAAKSALTRAVNRGEVDRDDMAIAERRDFEENIEKWVERTNMMTKEKFKERVNTPAYMSPAYESYWSM